MSYEEDVLAGETEEEPLEPLEEGALNDFRFEEDTDDDPDKDH